jgi:ATP-binding cassette subfamily C protein LapB
MTEPRAPPPPRTVQRLREDLIHPTRCSTAWSSLPAARPGGLARVAVGRAAAGSENRAAHARAGRARRRARRHGAQLQRVRSTHRQRALPAILVLRDNQACVLLGWDDDGAAGARAAARDRPGLGDAAARRAARALQRRGAVRAAALPLRRAHARSAQPVARHWFWSAISTQRFVYRDVLWAALLINLFALAFPMFSMNVYDRVVPNNAVETLWALAIGVLLILGADLFMRLLRSHFVDEASARIDVQISGT